jgi:hypothetical protein
VAGCRAVRSIIITRPEMPPRQEGGLEWDRSEIKHAYIRITVAVARRRETQQGGKDRR